MFMDRDQLGESHVCSNASVGVRRSAVSVADIGPSDGPGQPLRIRDYIASTFRLHGDLVCSTTSAPVSRASQRQRLRMRADPPDVVDVERLDHAQGVAERGSRSAPGAANLPVSAAPASRS